jgi:chromosome segregation ATPase
LKRQTERYRKQHAEVESEFRTLRSKLEDSSQERDRLSLRAKLESNRAEELEGLLASTRAKEYDFSMTNEEDSKRLKLLKERVDALSEDNERLTNRLEAVNATNAQLSNELENIKPDSNASAKNTKDSESQTLNAARNLAKSLAHSESVVIEQQRRMREIMEESKDLRERVEEAENRAASTASFAKQAENKAKRFAARESELRVQLQGALEDLRLAREASKRFADENGGFTADGEEFKALKRSLEEALEEKEKLEK